MNIDQHTDSNYDPCFLSLNNEKAIQEYESLEREIAKYNFENRLVFTCDLSEDERLMFENEHYHNLVVTGQLLPDNPYPKLRSGVCRHLMT